MTIPFESQMFTRQRWQCTYSSTQVLYSIDLPRLKREDLRLGSGAYLRCPDWGVLRRTVVFDVDLLSSLQRFAQFIEH